MARQFHPEKFTYQIMDHVDMNGEELVDKLNKTFKTLWGKPVFLFNGKPYQTGEKYNHVNDGTPMVLFRWSSLRSAREPILKAFYGIDKFRATSEGIRLEDITGYDVVDVYEGKYYIGTYDRITTRDGANYYGTSYVV